MTNLNWSPALTSVGIALAHSIWQVGLVATLLAIGLRLLRDHEPQARYAACLGAMVAVTAAFVVTLTIVRVEPPVYASAIKPAAMPAADTAAARSVSDNAPVPRESRVAQPDAEFVDAAEFDAGNAESSGYSDHLTAELDQPSFAMHADNSPPANAQPILTEHTPARGIAGLGALGWALPLSALIWSAGVVLLAGRLLAGHLGLRRIRGSSSAPAEWISDMASRLQIRLHVVGNVGVRVSGRVRAPMAFGLIRPVIILPVSLASGCPAELVEAVLAHELAHIRRRDLWVNLVQRIVETLLFYHPAMWWISGRMRLERELCCDALAVQATGRREEYARTLVTLSAGAATTPLGLTMLGPRISLSNRVRRVLGLPTIGNYGHSWLAGPLTVVAAVIVLVAAQVRTDTASAAPAQKGEAVAQEGADAAALPAIPTTSIIETRFDSSDADEDDERRERQLELIPQAWSAIKGFLSFRDALESGDRQRLSQTFMPQGESATPAEVDALLADFAALGLQDGTALHPAYREWPWSPRAVRLAPAQALICSADYSLRYGDDWKEARTVCWLQSSDGQDWEVTRVALHSSEQDWKLAIAEFDNEVIRQSDEGPLPEIKAFYFKDRRLAWLTESVSHPGSRTPDKGANRTVQHWLGLRGGTAEEAAEFLNDYYFFYDTGDSDLADDGKLPPRVRIRTVEHTIQTRISGTVKEVLVDDFEPVKAGDVLLVLENDEEQIAVEEARVHVEGAMIELERAKKGQFSQQEMRAITNRVRLAELELKRREAALAKTRLVSPVDGTVRVRFLRTPRSYITPSPGKFLAPGTTVFGVRETLITPVRGNEPDPK